MGLQGEWDCAHHTWPLRISLHHLLVPGKSTVDVSIPVIPFADRWVAAGTEQVIPPLASGPWEGVRMCWCPCVVLCAEWLRSIIRGGLQPGKVNRVVGLWKEKAPKHLQKARLSELFIYVVYKTEFCTGYCIKKISPNNIPSTPANTLISPLLIRPFCAFLTILSSTSLLSVQPPFPLSVSVYSPLRMRALQIKRTISWRTIWQQVGIILSPQLWVKCVSVAKQKSVPA